ncbi:MAG: GT4 family glycosyltransferase PelF [Pseudomonadales bacterium]|nr:GT4 family glycosyltransferase PelF [Pseudomonadales bacterium]
MKILRQSAEADIGLLLEGTYPYVSGGVSSWIAQMLKGFPQYRFALCFLGSREEDYGDLRYTLPDHVVHCEVHYLHQHKATSRARKHREHGDPDVVTCLRHMHTSFRQGDLADADLNHLMQFQAEGRHDERDLTETQDAWNFITENYRQYCTDPSFVDYFWTVRIMHQPLWLLMSIVQNFPRVRLFHTISTGYAGFLGALLKQQRQCPLILSEHGIYTKERKIDLFQAQWIKDNRGVLEKDTTDIAYFRQMWIRFFEALGRECYGQSDHIVALYETNRLRQIQDGAPAERTRNIPNGIDLAKLSSLANLRSNEIPAVICLIGRVVPIKDIKTFIRAMRTVANHMPEVQAWIAGPEEEDPQYALECHQLTAGLGLGETVKFLGFQRIDALLPQVGLIVLSSISEALPLVLLEGFAAGVPSIATDVGSCRQLIEGLSPEDRALGHAGCVVGIADPASLAQACIDLLADPVAWKMAQKAGQQRVAQFYTQDMMFTAYRNLYEKTLESSWQA